MSGRCACVMLSLLLSACIERLPFVVLSIEDPDGVAAGYGTLHVGPSRAALLPMDVTDLVLPVSVTVTAKTTGEKVVWVEVRDGQGVALARGSAAAIFARRGTPTAAVRLAKACSDNYACNHGTYCESSLQCRDDVCVAVGLPCVSSFACVQTTCVELGGGAGTCNVSVDHAACPGGEYCNPAAGCIPGQGCQSDDECQDAYQCNGAERCVNFVCTGGVPPSVDDGDACTLDGCDDRRSAMGEQAIFHYSLPTFDGSACALPGVEPPTMGVCVSAKGGCVASECGDGVVFADGVEVCDESGANRDEWSLTRHCNASCTGWGSYCGDEQIDDGFETCDEGAGNGSGTGCTSSCGRDGWCGDGQVQTVYEQCDDQNSDDCDGCRTNCERGCNCFAPNPCSGANWCEQGQCVACAVPMHCGPACESCGPTVPLCGGVSAGCLCDADVSLGLRGSCSPGSHCDGNGECVVCDDVQHCGQECLACGGDTPVCGGAQVGCVVNPATDPPSGGCAGKSDFTLCVKTTTPDRSYDICIGGVCVSPGCGSATCNPRGPSFAKADVVAGWEYPDMNQRSCYNAGAAMTCTIFPCAADGSPAFCGQDAQYGWDKTHPNPQVRWSRTVDPEPVVADHITDLVWQGCVAGRSGAMCEAGGFHTRAWAEALAYCDGLEWGGYADWRLPDYHELDSIVDAGRSEPAINVTVFPATQVNWFWSSTSDAGDDANAWLVDFNTGMGGGVTAKIFKILVRCVRPGPFWQAWDPDPRFARNEPVPASGELVVVDNRTKLLWQGCPAQLSGADCGTGAAPTFTWQDALLYCGGLTWAGYSDWRLPSRAELASIVDRSQVNQAIDGAAFPGTMAESFWSGTTYAWSPVYANGVDFAGGRVWAIGKAGAMYARCVRPGP